MEQIEQLIRINVLRDVELALIESTLDRKSIVHAIGLLRELENNYKNTTP